MNTAPENPRHPSPANADALAQLLHRAGARPEVDALRKARVERHVRAAWQAQLRRRRWRRGGWALAASLAVIGLLLGLQRWQLAQPQAELALVLHLSGRVVVEDAQGRRPLGIGDRLRAGDRLLTANDSYAALSIDRLQALRLDQHTALQLLDAQSLRLQQGAVYLDSGSRAGGVTVTTPLLQARDIGTRFEVRHHSGDATAAGNGSSVAVREGAVEIDAEAAARQRLGAEEQLQLQADGRSQRSPLPAHDPHWAWTLEAAAPFSAEGRSLRALLDWYAEQAGLTLVIEQPEQLRARLDAPLQGDLAGLSAAALLDVARAAGPLQLRIDSTAGKLHVSP